MRDKTEVDLINDILRPTHGMTTDEIRKFLSLNAIMSLSALRGIMGDEFVRDFLIAAIEDESKPTIKVATEH